ncbi:hypothetical protein [Opitutus sp. ER46]|uniref:hypothetical protein n=1 Tax=Opitutus sp. ER46 TaxID=2161864 RepID=UPI000D325F30|nr:hypothetical protein [Opitutus sp. ER46]PTX92486.1 hypothetical protein DB354_14230 [Opitutus sp. ER46]
MWQKFKEQIPAVILTALLVIGGAFWLRQQAVNEMIAKQQAELAPLREQNDRQGAALDEAQRQLADMRKTLNEAIAKREADVFRTDEEVQKMNTERMDLLAEAIAKKIQPYNPLPKTPEEAERMQNEQVDKVSSRMAERIQPILSEMAKDQNLTRDSIAQYSNRISEQVGHVLASEMNRNQQLNNNLQQTQAAAQDALKLSHEITALYLSTFKDQGLITRLLTLPANVVKDAASLSIVSSSDRKKVEESLVTRMSQIEKQLATLQAQNPDTGTPAATEGTPAAAPAPTPAPTPTAHPQRPGQQKT